MALAVGSVPKVVTSHALTHAVRTGAIALSRLPPSSSSAVGAKAAACGREQGRSFRQYSRGRAVQSRLSPVSSAVPRSGGTANHTRVAHGSKPRNLSFAAAAPVVAAGLTPVGMAVAGASALAAVGLATRYKVCNPNEYLVRTGAGISEMKITKKGFQWPFQKCSMVSVNPSTYAFRLHQMSKGKVEFELPVVFTIGPILPTDDEEAFKRYCKLLKDTDPDDVESTIKGVIEGETRALTANLTVEEMFSGKEKFRKHIQDQLAADLNMLGVRIYNANIQEMKDFDEKNKYFEYRKQRAIEMANNEAREDVAEAKKHGDLAVSQRERDSRIGIAQNERLARVEEYQNQQAILQAKAETDKAHAAAQRIDQVSHMEAQQAVKEREQHLQAAIEEARFVARTKSMRADILSEATASAEAKERLADAVRYAEERKADAMMYSKEKEAQAILKLAEAKAEGQERIMKACGQNEELVKFWMIVEKDLLNYNEIARAQAEAVRDMKPSITYWSTGGGDEKGDFSTPITKLVQGILPLARTVKDQWSMSKMPSISMPSTAQQSGDK